MFHAFSKPENLIRNGNFSKWQNKHIPTAWEFSHPANSEEPFYRSLSLIHGNQVGIKTNAAGTHRIYQLLNVDKHTFYSFQAKLKVINVGGVCAGVRIWGNKLDSNLLDEKVFQSSTDGYITISVRGFNTGNNDKIYIDLGTSKEGINGNVLFTEAVLWKGFKLPEDYEYLSYLQISLMLFIPIIALLIFSSRTICQFYKNLMSNKLISYIFSIAILILTSSLLSRYTGLNMISLTKHPVFSHTIFNPTYWSQYISDRNTATLILSSILLLLISWPIGFLLINLLPSYIISRDNRLFLSFPFGFLALSFLWSFLILYFRRINIYLYLLFILFIMIVLFLINKKHEKDMNIYRLLPNHVSRILLPLSVMIYALLQTVNLYRDSLVPGGWDAMSPAFVEFIVKSEKAYPLVHPYLDQSVCLINYLLPSYDVLVIIFSYILPFSITTVQMLITILCSVLLSLAVFLLLKQITNNDFIATLAGILSMGRAFLWQTRDGNSNENLSMLAIAVSLIILERILMTAHKTKHVPLSLPLILGCSLSLSMLGNTKVFQRYFIAYALFFLIIILLERKEFKLIYLKALFFSAISFSLLSVPWVFAALKNVSPIAKTSSVDWQPVLDMITAILRWNSYPLVIFSFCGLLSALILSENKRFIFYIVLYTTLTAFTIEYYRIFAFIKPLWFSIKEVPYDPWYDTNKLFSSIFPFAWINEIGFTGFTITLPILFSLFIKLLYDLSKKLYLNKILIVIFLTIVCIQVIVTEVYALPGGAGVILSKEDFNVLRKLSVNSKYESTLILNSWHGSWEGYCFPEGNWAAPISGRKTVFFRGDSIFFVTWIYSSIDKEKAKAIYINPCLPQSYALLKKWRITHVFLPKSVPEEIKARYNRCSYMNQTYEDGTYPQSAMIYTIK